MSHRRPLLRPALAIAAALLTLAPAASAASAAPQNPDGAAPSAGATTWSLGPAGQDGPDSRTSLRFEIDPGGSGEDRVALRNFSDRAVTFDVYPSDGVVTADGVFDVLPPGAPPQAAGSWVAVGDGAPGESVQVTVDAVTDVVLPVRLDVPADVTPGDHPVGLVAQPSAAAGEVVGLDTRVGTRLHLRVAGDVVPTFEVTGVTPVWAPSWNPFAPGTLDLDVTLANTGNVRLGASTSATAAAVLGPVTEVDAVGVREILPGDTATVRLPVGEVWPLLRTGGQVRATPMTVGDDAALDLTTVTSSWSAWLVPWPQLVALAALVAAVVVALRLRRRRRSAVQRRIDAAVSEALAREPAGV
ncbi:hypothetical protein [Litorihabitans aurantiacus]|uniref:DUF916 domain-containing protein n=1 Tax=Litorihabitans aurantiacus TaxID=1930061 RepID=A0AA37UTA6_9MICO|nr:hypothetical protein [Litorihabitans aurantiacus]GMA30830.1 hypothetical protein GCM10025875_08220 [Litorihabitans aurantiacus]